MNELVARPGLIGRLLRPLGMTFPPLLFAAVVVTLLVFGWWHRDESDLVAEAGLGYALGILGGSLMLLLLFYPLRKRVKALHRALSMKFWFRLHMTCGILGPLAILYHANFRLGSINSAVAMVCMLLVAGSGLVGRYLYVRIHRGLYGRRRALGELQGAVAEAGQRLNERLPADRPLHDWLQQLERLAQTPARGLWHSLRLRRLTRQAARHTRRAWRDALRREVRQGGLARGEARRIWRQLERYLDTVHVASGFRVNERLFALWHVLHLPLFVMMLITGIVHVFVVHVY